MPNKADGIVKALDELATAITASNAADIELTSLLGWVAPSYSRNDLANMVTLLSKQIKDVANERLSDKFDYERIVTKIVYVRNNSVQNLWNGNGVVATQTIVALVELIQSAFRGSFEKLIPPPPDWVALDEQDLLPKSLSRKLRALKAQIATITTGTDDLAQKIEVINAGHETALSLPTDLESLEEARQQIADTLRVVEGERTESKKALEAVNLSLSHVQHSEAEATKLVQNTEDAYSAATTKGLGEAFQIRADRTANSMWVWVGGLLLALIASAFLGINRVNIVEQMITQKAPAALTEMHTILAFLAVAAPIWFAWIATKQIGQRFRLSEDYAYKASVAKAYEGYRREAARLDEGFANRLFKTALDRLEEPPLRYVEQETHGSPLHEWWRLRQAARAGAREGAETAVKYELAAAPEMSKPTPPTLAAVPTIEKPSSE